MMIKTLTNQQLKLKDGRLLTYAEYGDPVGQPLFFFHGGNDSRLAGALLHQTAQKLGVRLIAPDRPGFGRSTFQPNRTLLDWPKDITQLADALELDQFAVAGHSGGGPHAVAVAHAMPNRLTHVALISSAAPPGSRNRGMHPLFRMVNFFMGVSPTIHRRLMEQNARQLIEDPDKFISQWGQMSKEDGRLFQSRPEVVQMIIAEMQEAVHQGSDGIVQEHPLYKKSWGFDLSEIHAPIHVWHGLADPQAVPAWSEHLLSLLPNGIPHFIPEEGHFSMMVNHQEAIFKEMRK